MKCSLTKDQNFNRQTFCKNHPDTRTCCIIPKGKYIVTGPGNFRQLVPKALKPNKGTTGKWFSVFKFQLF